MPFNSENEKFDSISSNSKKRTDERMFHGGKWMPEMKKELRVAVATTTRKVIANKFQSALKKAIVS